MTRAQLMREHGLCVGCKAESPNSYRCPACREKQRAYDSTPESRERKAACKKRLMEKRHRLGLCPGCGTDKQQRGMYCEPCKARTAAYRITESSHRCGVCRESGHNVLTCPVRVRVERAARLFEMATMRLAS